MTTANPFDQMTTRDEWHGAGYLGGRKSALDDSDPEAPAQPAIVAQTDAWLIAYAQSQGIDDEALFVWANSTYGRHFGDAIFGNSGPFADRVEDALRWELAPGQRPL